MKNNKPERKTVTIRILIAVFFIVYGLIIIPVNIKNYYTGLETENWHKTEGTVIESRVIIGSGRNGGVRSPRIIYDYEISGIIYRGKRVSYANVWTNVDNDVFEFIKLYPAGSQMAVYYNPIKPSQSVLVPGSHWRAFIWSALGLPIIVFGLYVWRNRYN